MAGALKAGGVYVAVSAAIGDFAKTMGAVAKSVEQTAKKVKESAQVVADVGTIFAGAMGAAVLAAGQSNRAIQADLEKLKGYLYTLAADLGDAFGPFLHQLTEAVGSVVGAFQRLSPEMKESVARVIAVGAAMGVAGGLLAKGAGIIEGVAKATGALLVPALNAASAATKALGVAGGKVFPELGKAVAGMEAGWLRSMAKMTVSMAGILIPVAAVAAALVGIALLAGTLYQAWHSSGLKEWFFDLWASVKELGGKLFSALREHFLTLKSQVLEGVQLVLDGLAFMVRHVATMLKPLGSLPGAESLKGLLDELSTVTGEQLMKDLAAGASLLADKAGEAAQYMVDGAKVVGQEVVESARFSANYVGKGLKRLGKDTGLDELPGKLKAALGDALGGVLGGPAGRIRTPFEDVEVGTVGGGGELPSAAREFQQGGSAAFRVLVERSQRLAADAAKAIEEARKNIVGRFASALGRVTDLVNAFTEGVTATGSPMGGIAAVALELLQQSEGFQVVMETVNGLLQLVADALGTVLLPLQGLIGALALVVNPILEAVAPAFNMLGAVVEPLVPILVVLGQVLEALAPALAIAVTMTTALMLPVMLLGPVLYELFKGLKWLGGVVLSIVKSIGGVWNGIVDAIQSVLRTIANFSIFGKKPLGFLNQLADGLNGLVLDTDALTLAQQELAATTWQSAKEKANETAAVLRNREATQKATEALSNVPTAWKAALRRFEAQDAQGSPMAPVPAPPPPSTGGSYGRPPGGVGSGGTVGQPGAGSGWGPAVVHHGDVILNANNPGEALRMYEETMDRRAFAETGSRVRGGSRYAQPEVP